MMSGQTGLPGDAQARTVVPPVESRALDFAFSPCKKGGTGAHRRPARSRTIARFRA